MKTNFKTRPIAELLKYFNENFPNYSIRITNYTMQIFSGDDKYMFSTSPLSKKVFIWYNLIKKSNGGEWREIPRDFKYYDFSGIENITSDCYCVDLNSAYLSVLKRDGILSDVHFEMINKRSSKRHRLQSVGMFAKNPIVISFVNGQVKTFETEKDPFQWLFYHAVRETFLAMKKVMQEMHNEFIFFWVDGIFIRGDPERAMQIFDSLGLPAKIEKITELKKGKNFLIFKKDGEQKILFLPKSKKHEKKELIDLVKSAIKL